jgi:anti-sigma factor RsiW
MASEREEQALNEALGRRPKYAAPQSLTARLRTQWLPRKQRRWVATASLALAASVIAVVGGAVGERALVLRSLSHERLNDEAVNDHLRILEGDRPLEVLSGGIHQVKPWFAGHVDFAPRVPEMPEDEFPLVGGATARFLDRRAAVFEYKRRLHGISLLVFRAEGLELPAIAEERSVRGFTVILWRDADEGYALVSDVDPKELWAMQRLISQR